MKKANKILSIILLLTLLLTTYLVGANTSDISYNDMDHIVQWNAKISISPDKRFVIASTKLDFVDKTGFLYCAVKLEVVQKNIETDEISVIQKSMVADYKSYGGIVVFADPGYMIVSVKSSHEAYNKGHTRNIELTYGY